MPGMFGGYTQAPGTVRHDGRECCTVSMPLGKAIRIAKERQRSKSSRRKIFREEPDRYLDIVNLMRDSGPGQDQRAGRHETTDPHQRGSVCQGMRAGSGMKTPK